MIENSKSVQLRQAPSDLPQKLRDIIDYRKSGLSLNHVVGCPLNCGYCVRHLFSNYEMKQPHAIVDDETAVEQLTNYWAFVPNVTPIQIFNRATDPFLPGVKERLFATLMALDEKGLKNTVLVITRWRIDPADIEFLDKLKNLKLTVLVTWSGIEDRRIEPVDSSIAEKSLEVLKDRAGRTKSILYWRPLIDGLNDTPFHLKKALELSDKADATVFTGLFFREEIRAYFREIGVADLYEQVARRKILSGDLEQRVLHQFSGRSIFRKTSCAVAFVHGISDYNGHYGIKEICEICPDSQRKICRDNHKTPDASDVEKLAKVARLPMDGIEIDERRVIVSGSEEYQRYFIQHSLNYQVHDRSNPHFRYRHGRAEIGWE